MNIELRDYQDIAIEAMRNIIRKGTKSQMLCSPTASGKTVLASYLLKECYRLGKRATFVADRISLIDQTSKTFDKYAIPHGVIQATHWRYRPYEQIQVASVQTLARRKWTENDLIIIDEAHTNYKTIIDKIEKEDAIVIGLSATPFTKGLGKYYKAITCVTTTNKLIHDGFLSDYEIYAASQPNMDGVKIVAGEWNESEAADRAMPIVGDCVREYLKHGNDKKFIAFGCNVAHCIALKDQFLSAGVSCELYTYKDDADAKEDIVNEFRKPNSTIKGLISVSALAKGFDVPDIEVVIMARPLRKSLSEHIQIIGRGLRISAGKEKCTVLDHSGNCLRFWQETNDFFENGIHELCDGNPKEKEKKEKKDEKEPRKCPNCHHLHNPAPACPMCGFTYKVKSEIRHEAGELSKLGERTRSNTLFEELAYYALVTRKKEPVAAQKWIQAMTKGITGQWSNKRITDVTPIIPTIETVNKIKHQNIKWAKGRKFK
jgi:superfamily II DNA or RNA helicase